MCLASGIKARWSGICYLGTLIIPSIAMYLSSVNLISSGRDSSFSIIFIISLFRVLVMFLRILRTLIIYSRYLYLNLSVLRAWDRNASAAPQCKRTAFLFSFVLSCCRKRFFPILMKFSLTSSLDINTGIS